MVYPRFIPIFLALVIGLVAGGPALYAAQNPDNVGNPGVVEIPDPSIYSRVVAVSDVHGEFEKVHELLLRQGLITTNGHWAGGKTLFIIVGDTINKGNHSVDLIDMWIRLSEEASASGGRVIHLLGNHEAEILAAENLEGGRNRALRKEARRALLPVEELFDLSTPHGRFLRSLPVMVKVGNVLFTHSGWIPKAPWEALAARLRTLMQQGRYGDPMLLGPKSLLDDRSWWTKSKAVRSIYKRMESWGVTSIVFGHQKAALGKENRIAFAEATNESGESRTLINIDTGASEEAGRAQLLVFDDPAEMTRKSAPKSVFVSKKLSGELKPIRPGIGVACSVVEFVSKLVDEASIPEH